MLEKKEEKEKEAGGGGSMDKPPSPPHVEGGDSSSEPSTHKEPELHVKDDDSSSGSSTEPRKESAPHVEDDDLQLEPSTHKEPAPHTENSDLSSSTQQLEPTQSQSLLPPPPPSRSPLPDDFPSGWKRIPRVRYMPGMPGSYFYVSKEGHMFDTLKQVRAFLHGEEVKTHFNVPVIKNHFVLIDAPASPHVWPFDTDTGNNYGQKRPWEDEDDDTRTTGFENYMDTRIDGGMYGEEMPSHTTHGMWFPDYDALTREYDYYGPQYPYSPGYAEERNGPRNREQYARMAPPEYKRPNFGAFEEFPREYKQNTGFDRPQGAGIGTSIARTENRFVNYPRDFQGRESTLAQAGATTYPRTNPPRNPPETHLQQAQKEPRDSLGGPKEPQSIFSEQKGLPSQGYPNGLKPSNTGNQQKQLLSQQENHQKDYMILNEPKELNPSTQPHQDTQTNPDIEPYKILPPPPLSQPPPPPPPPQKGSQEDGELPRSFVDKVFSDVVGKFRSYSRDMSSGQRGSSIRFKNDIMMNSIAEALDAIRSEKDIFVEVPSCSGAFKDVIKGTKDFMYKRGTMAILDRVWNIFSYPLRSKYYSIPPEKRGNEVLGFHSSKVSNLIGIAKEGFHVNSSEVSISTGKKEMLGRLVYTADDCKNAIKYSDEFTFCLVVTIFEGRVYNANSTMEDMTVTKLRNSSFDTIHAERVSRRGSMRASPPERILPRQLLMFRKVKREDLWIYVHYNLTPMDAAWLTVSKESVRKRQSEPPNVELRKRIATLMNKTHALWNVKQKNQQQRAEPMTPFLVLQTNKYACFSSREPVASIHLVVVPKARTKWTDLTPRSAPVIIELYAYAMFVKGELQRIPQCPQLSILFPVCPSQDQVHCHIMAKAEMNVGFNTLKYNNFVPVEVFVYNLVHGKYDKMWYNNNKSENRDYWD